MKFTFTPGAGYQYGGEAGDFGQSCECCGQHFEGPSTDIVAGAASACAANDRRGSDRYDRP